MKTQTLQFAESNDGVELQRAELYGLLARLFIAAPDQPLLDQFAIAVTDTPQAGAFLHEPWLQMVGALRASRVVALVDEYESLFLGMGKPEVFLYGSYYLAGFLNERPLAALRSDLARLSLTRDDGAVETEDHVSYGFEVMRYLIAGDDLGLCNLTEQQRFFRKHLQPWLLRMCEAIDAHEKAQVYRTIAQFTRAFVDVEIQAFDILE
mgnify:CR=1